MNDIDLDQKIVITGIGVVSPIGIGKDEFWKGLAEGKSGIKPVTLFDTSNLRSKLAGEITDFKPEEILGEKGLRNLDRTTKLALCAAKLCLDDSGFKITEENTDDVGVVLGSTMGSVRSISEFDKEAIRNGPRAVNPALFPNTVINSPASQISIRFGIKGFNTTISSGFTSGLDAISYAKNFLLLGRAKAVLCGGVEELCEQTFKGLYKLGFLSASKNGGEELCAPFDRRRNGAILGEGSIIFLMETLKSAQGRNAKIYSQIEGVGQAYDKKSFNRYSLRGDGIRRAIADALTRSNLSQSQIDYISCSANSTRDGDLSESRAIADLIHKDQRCNFMTSTSKSMIGETYSAASSFQVASSLYVMEKNRIFPTINFKEPDEKCEIDCTPNVARDKKVNRVLVSSASPTGQSSALVLAREGS